MATTALVAYATRYGSTREVADTIADTLRERGLGAEVRPAREVRSLDGYKAVVLGAALYNGRWHRTRAPLRLHRKALLNLPVAIFALGPLSATEEAEQASRAQLDRALASVHWLTPVAVGMFGGVIDPARLRFPLNRMPKSDTRDWTAIRAFATLLAVPFRFTRLETDDQVPVAQ